MPTPTQYVYTISTGIPSGIVENSRLEDEIKSSTIITQLAAAGVRTDGDTLTVHFKDALSSTDKLTLDGSASPAAAAVCLPGSVLGDHSGASVGSVATEVVLTTPGGSPLLSTVPSGPCSYKKWTGTPTSFGSTYTTVFSDTGPDGLLYETVFQLDSDKIDMRILVDGSSIGEFDFEEMSSDFKFSDNESVFGLREYASKRWIFRPLFPIRFSSSLTIQMRAQSGTKKAERGITVTGKQ